MYGNGAVMLDEDSSYQYEPWIGPNREMGYRITDDLGNQTFIYLNPSSGSDDGVPTVFVYRGEHGQPDMDVSVHYYDVQREA